MAPGEHVLVATEVALLVVLDDRGEVETLHWPGISCGFCYLCCVLAAFLLHCPGGQKRAARPCKIAGRLHEKVKYSLIYGGFSG